MHAIHGISMKTTVNRLRLLVKLQENRQKHEQIVREATDKYYDVVAEKLKNKLAEVEEAKAKKTKPKTVAFSTTPPISHLSEYDTVIAMLEYGVEENVTLTADEARQLIEDKWDWMKTFLATNSAYSAAARNLGDPD